MSPTQPSEQILRDKHEHLINKMDELIFDPDCTFCVEDAARLHLPTEESKK